MSTISITILLAGLILAPSAFYLHVVARRAGLPQEKEHWVFWGVLAGTIAVWGTNKENAWILLVGLLLAAFALIRRACRVSQGLKKNPNEPKG